MATVDRILAESRVRLEGIPWHLYQTIAESRGDRPLPRLTYHHGVLELMSPSFRHEALTSRVRIFVFMLARGPGRPCLDAGSTRWEREDVSSGKEPDACFYLENEPRVRGLRDIDLTIHPPPDLAVEVEISHPLSDALRVYEALRVPEVWRYDGDSLTFLHLGNDGTYIEESTSRSFPMLHSLEALEVLAKAEELSQTVWSNEVEEWAKRTL